MHKTYNGNVINILIKIPFNTNKIVTILKTKL